MGELGPFCELGLRLRVLGVRMRRSCVRCAAMGLRNARHRTLAYTPTPRAPAANLDVLLAVSAVAAATTSSIPAAWADDSSEAKSDDQEVEPEPTPGVKP